MMNNRLIAALQHLWGPEAADRSSYQTKARSSGLVRRPWRRVVWLLLAGTLVGASAGRQPTPADTIYVQEVPAASEEATIDTLSALSLFLNARDDADAEANSQVDLLVDAFGSELVASHYDFEALEREDRMRRLQQFCTLGLLLVILIVVYKRRKREKT